MANHIYIYCRSSVALEYRDVVERIELSYFDDCAIDPPDVGAQRSRTDWTGFNVRYDTAKQPIRVERITAKSELDELVLEALERIDENTEQNMETLKTRMRETRQGSLERSRGSTTPGLVRS